MDVTGLKGKHIHDIMENGSQGSASNSDSGKGHSSEEGEQGCPQFPGTTVDDTDPSGIKPPWGKNQPFSKSSCRSFLCHSCLFSTVLYLSRYQVYSVHS